MFNRFNTQFLLKSRASLEEKYKFFSKVVHEKVIHTLLQTNALWQVRANPKNIFEYSEATKVVLKPAVLLETLTQR